MISNQSRMQQFKKVIHRDPEAAQKQLLHSGKPVARNQKIKNCLNLVSGPWLLVSPERLPDRQAGSEGRCRVH